jgi:uncharacterized protein VirK/YbjX
MTMTTNSEGIMKENSLVNFITRLWAKFNSFAIFKHYFSKFKKLVDITCVQVLGSMDDEGCFSITTFIKNVEKLLHLSFGFVQKQLYTMFLHN